MVLFLTVLHVMTCVVLVVVVLLQHGKGADIGAVFGGGASTTVFGSRGAGNFLTRLTTGSALLFMVTSLALSYLANTSESRSIFEDTKAPAAAAAPKAEEPKPGQAPGTAPGGFEEVKPPAAPSAPAAGGAEASATQPKATEPKAPAGKAPSPPAAPAKQPPAP
jgi:preprotein translocase subunit SecG